MNSPSPHLPEKNGIQWQLHDKNSQRMQLWKKYQHDIQLYKVVWLISKLLFSWEMGHVVQLL